MSEIIPNVVVSMPSQLFTMARSFKACSNGRIYIGKIDTDPTIPENQIQVYMECENGDLVPAPQPIIINAAGYPVYAGQIAKFVTVQGHSMAIYDSYGGQQFYFPNVSKYDPDRLRTDLSESDGASMVGYGDSTVLECLNTDKRRKGDVIYVADFLPNGFIDGSNADIYLQEAVSAVNAVANTTHNGKPVTLEFPSGSFKQSQVMTFKRPVLLSSNGVTKIEFTGSGNQIIFGPDGITFNGGNGGIDHRLHVTYGFNGVGIFTFNGVLYSDGIVFNEYVTNPRILGLSFVNYGSEDYYQIKLWGQCWDIFVDKIRHTYTNSKAVNFLSANGKMKIGTVDYGNSRLHVGSDVFLQIEGTRSGGVCFDVGGADYRFDGVAQGWRITHQLGAFASNPRINGYHETIYPECEALITYGGTTSDTVIADDGYFDGGVIGGDGIYWNAHNVSGPEGYPSTNCVFMKAGRSDVVLRNCHLSQINITSFDNTKIFVSTNIISGKPSYGNSFLKIDYPAVRIHEQNALIQPWRPAIETENLVINGSGRLSRAGASFNFTETAINARVFDFWQYYSTGPAPCNFYRSLFSNESQFTHEGIVISIVVPIANNDTKSLQVVLDKNAFKCQGKEVTLSFMMANGEPNIATRISVSLVLSFSSSGGVSKAYSFGSFNANAGWELKKFTLNIPFMALVSDDSALAYLSFDIPSNQKVNVQIANVNLCEGTVAIQGPSKLKDWEILSQSLAYYGS
ncbi:phage head-binding domain-containing protein [Xenorhabdus bovienii]|uniref:phage head-binding domain-containing protein n=1 Tax=Xenorhabdus bovienii TaxID=40576 RepID=UPI0023B266B0|nr:phage head-binding domain-containing protein [Xenorhabdus bovienii]